MMAGIEYPRLCHSSTRPFVILPALKKSVDIDSTLFLFLALDPAIYVVHDAKVTPPFNVAPAIPGMYIHTYSRGVVTVYLSGTTNCGMVWNSTSPFRQFLHNVW